MSAFFLLILAAAVSMLLIPLAILAAPHLGMVDMPDPRKVHASPVPRVGGWGIALGCITPLLMLFPISPLLQSFVGGILVLFVFGMWDDARELGHWVKFIGQACAASLVVYYGDLHVYRLPFLESVTLDPAVGRPFTVFAIVGVINAINHSDGLDGLAGGESMLSLIAMAFLGHLVSDGLAVGIALSTIGGTLGFLRYNTHPARVFMGDAGSQVLGFTLAFLAVYLTQVSSTAVSPALPALLLGLPLSDILAVLFQRIRGGMNWFKASRNHVHHRLLDLGFSHFQTVVAIYSIQAALVIGAVLLRYESDWLVGLSYLAVIAALFAGLLLAERRGWMLGRTQGEVLWGIPALLDRSRRSSLMRDAVLWLIAMLAAVVMLAGVLWVDTVPADFGVAAGIVAVAVIVQMFRAAATPSLLMRAATYAAAAFAVHLFVQNPRVDLPLAGAIATGVMMVLAVAVAIHIRFLSERRFATTPTDFLVAFGVLALVAFDSVDARVNSTAQFVTFVIIMFYACEVVMVNGQAGRHLLLLRWAVLGALTIAAVRAAVAHA
jgi:UDP-GlcNAc:undecaprenyl-phosphate GlcNAc-1-phosphate transferase